jgi:hypothetical protein
LLHLVGDLFELNVKLRWQKVKEKRGYSHEKEEGLDRTMWTALDRTMWTALDRTMWTALDRTMWTARFGRAFGPVVRQTAIGMNYSRC